MRILVVNNFAHFTGGADHLCFATADRLRARGHEVALLASADLDGGARPYPGAYVRCRVTRERRDQLALRERPGVAAAALWNREAAAAAADLLRQFQPDVIHAHKLYPQLSVAPVRVAARNGTPVIQALHDYELISASALDAAGGWRDTHESRRSYRALNSATFLLRRTLHRRAVTTFIAVSGFVADRYRAHGIDARVLRNFALTPVSRAAPDFERRQGIAFAGRLAPEKGIEDVVALARATSVPVTIAGAGAMHGFVAEAERRIPNLRFAGLLNADELTALLASVRVLVMPSRWEEPAGLAALDAMALGTPVCAYDSGGLGEYVGRAGGGVVVGRRRDELIRVSRSLHDGREAWERLSRAGREGVARVFSPEGYITELEAIYAAAAGGAARGPGPALRA